MFSLKKLLRKIHLWLGLTSGIIVFIIAITGAIYVFNEDISATIYKDRRNIEVPKNTNIKSLTKMVATASALFDNQYPFQHIVIPNLPNHSISINFIERDNNAFGYWNYIKFNKTVYLNPYTGKEVLFYGGQKALSKNKNFGSIGKKHQDGEEKTTTYIKY